MRQLFFLILLFAIFSCKNNSLPKRGRSLLYNEGKCRVVSYYPIIMLEGDTKKMDKLNKALEHVNEMNHYVGRCSSYYSAEYSEKEKEIIGDYNVMYSSDSLLNIEFFRKFSGLSIVEYRSVFVDLRTLELAEGKEAMPEIDRGKLYPYVKRFIDSTGIDINLKAYERNSNYSIMFGRTKDDLVLYLGEEGEFGGYYKILIPLNKVMK